MIQSHHVWTLYQLVHTLHIITIHFTRSAKFLIFPVVRVMRVCRLPISQYRGYYLDDFFSELAVVVSLRLGADGVNIGYAQRSALKSPPFSPDRPLCVQLTYKALTAFSFKLACVTSAGEYRERILNRNTLSLGHEYHVLNVHIYEAEPPFKTCCIFLETETRSSGELTFLSKIAVFNGSCPVAGNANQHKFCDFFIVEPH